MSSKGQEPNTPQLTDPGTAPRLPFRVLDPLGLFLLLAVLVLAMLLTPRISLASTSSAMKQQECVVLLHGLGRTFYSMIRMQKALEREGFLTSNVGYASRKYPIEQLAMEAVPEGVEECRAQGARQIHFVTHSMGGILLRYYLNHHDIEELGRTVMLAPPNQGSEVIDEVGHLSFYQSILGPAGMQLSTEPDSIPNSLGPVEYSVGIIAGDRHNLMDGWFAEQIPGLDDGKVSIERAKIDGMSDFIIVPHSHTTIMNGDDVIIQTIQYMHEGRFYPAGQEIPRLEPVIGDNPFLDDPVE